MYIIYKGERQMSQYKSYYARVNQKKEDNTYEVGFDYEELEKAYNRGYMIPRYNPYKKSVIEGLIEACIDELEPAEKYIEPKLLHVAKGLLSTLSFMTSPEHCESWANHQFLEKDKQSMIRRLERAFDLEKEVRNIKNSFKRATLVPVMYSNEKERSPLATTLGGEQKQLSYYMAIAIPSTGDNRERFVYMVRTLAEMIDSLRPEKSLRNSNLDYFNGQTDEEIHEEWMAHLKRVSNGLIFLVNCTSWRDNELQSFDQYELERKSGLAYY